MIWRDGLSQLRALMGIAHGSRAFGAPIQVSLNLTNRCNIRCLHCYCYSPHADRPNLLPVKKARLKRLELPADSRLRRMQSMDAGTERTNAVMDEAIAMGTRRFQFGGNGEPFMHKNALEFIARAKRAGSYCIAYTNGLLLDRTVTDELLRMGFDSLRVTAMAGTPEMYSRTHPGSGAAAFDKLRENLLYIAERRNALRLRRSEVRLACIVVAQNSEGLVDFAEFAAAVGVDSVFFGSFDAVDDTGLSRLVPTPAQSARVREQLVEARAYLESRNIGHNIETFLKVFRGRRDTTELYRIIPCYYGWLALRVDLDGMVYACCRCYDSLGNVNENGLQDIWYGQAYRRFRQQALALNRGKAPVSGCDCNSCSHYTANLRVYGLRHPIRARFGRLESLSQSTR